MSFICPRCGVESHHPLDEDYGYCAKCHEFAENRVRSTAKAIHDISKSARDRGVLPMWTVYNHPKDYPEGFIARCFETGGGHSAPVATAFAIMGQIEVIRQCMLRCGLYCMTRSEGDDANIVETWM